jgi:hypothetical protein
VADDECRGDADGPRAGYERLRAAVLSSDGGAWRLGHGVLCARGMVAWMSAFGALAAPAATGTSPAGAAPAPSVEICEPPAGRSLAVPDAGQVVAVLAQMVLPLAA